ncbi:MAG: DUF938 domain-containing protein [Rhodospirillales bacterium]|nr:MAG: DUF938 domain-containing protein [Rhodospirillales bacterium]
MARKQFAAAADRNAGPILDVLRDIIPTGGRALEIASGTGQHVVAFAAAFPEIDWQPSDPGAEARDSISAWIADAGRRNVLPPLDIDVTRAGWATSAHGPYDLIVCINMIHIAPWEACVGLMRGAGTLLVPDGLLYMYGPYRRDGVHTAPSNAAFDRSLRLRDPDWGVRDLAKVSKAAARNGLSQEAVVPMPANNLSLVFRRIVA